MKNLSFLTLILLLISCNKSKDDPGTEGYLFPLNRLEISYVDTNGMDLLKQGNPNAFNKNTIKVYHLVNGEKKFDHLYFSCDKALCTLRIYPIGISYLELNSQITDTIISEIYRTQDNKMFRKIWYNEELLLEAEYGTEFYFTIVK